MPERRLQYTVLRGRGGSDASLLPDRECLGSVETIMIRCVSMAVAVVGPVFLSLAACAAPRTEPPDKQLSLPLGHNQKLEFVWIEPGRFQMGSPASDKLAGEVEKPQREVRIEKGFYLARTTVTFGQFQEFVLDAGYRTDAETETRPRLRGGHGFNADR